MVFVLDEDIIEVISSHFLLCLRRINHLLAFNRAYYQHQISLEQRFWPILLFLNFSGYDKSYNCTRQLSFSIILIFLRRINKASSIINSKLLKEWYFIINNHEMHPNWLSNSTFQLYDHVRLIIVTACNLRFLNDTKLALPPKKMEMMKKNPIVIVRTQWMWISYFFCIVLELKK